MKVLSGVVTMVYVLGGVHTDVYLVLRATMHQSAGLIWLCNVYLCY